jgi:hypothetical protein
MNGTLLVTQPTMRRSRASLGLALLAAVGLAFGAQVVIGRVAQQPAMTYSSIEQLTTEPAQPLFWSGRPH